MPAIKKRKGARKKFWQFPLVSLTLYFFRKRGGGCSSWKYYLVELNLHSTTVHYTNFLHSPLKHNQEKLIHKQNFWKFCSWKVERTRKMNPSIRIAWEFGKVFSPIPFKQSNESFFNWFIHCCLVVKIVTSCSNGGFFLNVKFRLRDQT